MKARPYLTVVVLAAWILAFAHVECRAEPVKDQIVSRFSAFFKHVLAGPVVRTSRRAELDWEALDGGSAGHARIVALTPSTQDVPPTDATGPAKQVRVNGIRIGASVPLRTGHAVIWRHDDWRIEVRVTRSSVPASGAPRSMEAAALDVADRLERVLSGLPALADAEGGKAGGTTAGGQAVRMESVRTITYRQISQFTDSFVVGTGCYPMVSRNGARLCMTFGPARDDPERRQRIGVIDSDGSGYRFVDRYASGGYIAATISADGRWVASSDGLKLRLAAADGSGVRQVIELLANIGSFRPAPDGSKVIFEIMRDSVQAGTNSRLERGIYIVSADGTGLRQIAGPAAIAQALSAAPADIGDVGSGYTTSIDVAEDNERIVFFVHARGSDRLLVVNVDGSGLREVLPPADTFLSVAISGNGAEVAATLRRKGADAYQGWVVGVDGSQPRKLTDKGGYSHPVYVTRDGSQVVFGYEGVLYNTDGSGAFPYATPASIGGSPRLNPDQLQGFAMGDSPRSCFWASDGDNGAFQIARVDIDPADPGVAPQITDVALSRSELPADDRTAATISARVRTEGTLLGRSIVARGYQNGVLDPVFGRYMSLQDAGTGVYSSESLKAAASVAQGAHFLRLMAEVKLPDGRHAGTAVQVGPVVVR